jgi:hypothetical protein
MICVQCHLQKYLHGSKKAWIMHGKDLAAHPIVEESEKGKSICAELNNMNDKTHTLAMAPCEPIALVLNLSTTPASLQQSIVEPVAEFPFLQDDYKIIPYDKEKLCDHASLISTTQLVHGHDTSILHDTHAKVRRVHCIDSEKKELKIIFFFKLFRLYQI